MMLPQIIANGIVAGLLYGLVGVGFALWYSTSRFFNIAYLVPFLLSGYGVYLVSKPLGMGLLAGVVSGIVLAALAGLLLEAALVEPMRRRHASALCLLLASVGVYIVVQAILAMAFGEVPLSIRGGELEPRLTIAGVSVTRIQALTAATSACIVVAVALFLAFARDGLKLRAIASDPELSGALGVPRERLQKLCAVLSSSVAAIGGLLFTYDTDLVPTMGFNLLFMGIAAAVVGGLRHPLAIACGGLLLGLAQHLAIWRLSSQWQDALAFLILLVFLVVRPQGIAGRPMRKVSV